MLQLATLKVNDHLLKGPAPVLLTHLSRLKACFFFLLQAQIETFHPVAKEGI